MPITIAPNKFHVKKTDGSGYLPCNVVTGETTEEQCTRVTNQGTSEVNRVVAKGNEVLADLSGSTEMEGMIAGTFAAANTYSAGTYVIYPTTVGSSTVNKLYRLTADHAANVTWENTSKVEVKLGNDVSDLKSAFINDIYLPASPSIAQNKPSNMTTADAEKSLRAVKALLLKGLRSDREWYIINALQRVQGGQHIIQVMQRLNGTNSHVITWSKTYTDPNGLEWIDLSDYQGSGVSGKILIDWSEVVENSTGAITSTALNLNTIASEKALVDIQNTNPIYQSSLGYLAKGIPSGMTRDQAEAALKAIKLLYLSGLKDDGSEYCIKALQRVQAGTHVIQIGKRAVGGSGSTESFLCVWSKSYTDSAGLEWIDLPEYQGSGVSGRLLIDWSEVTENSNGAVSSFGLNVNYIAQAENLAKQTKEIIPSNYLYDPSVSWISLNVPSGMTKSEAEKSLKAIKCLMLNGIKESSAYDIRALQRVQNGIHNIQIGIIEDGQYKFGCVWSKTYTDPNGFEWIDLSQYQGSGISGKILIDWSEVVENSNGAIRSTPLNNYVITESAQVQKTIDDASNNADYATKEILSALMTWIGNNQQSSQVDFGDLVHFICYGQSWSVGASTSPQYVISHKSIYNNLMFDGGVITWKSANPAKYSKFVPLEERIVPGGFWETPVSGQCEMVKQLLAVEDVCINPEYNLIGTAPGEGGKTLAQLSKGTEYYQYFMDAVTNAKSIADEKDQDYEVKAFSFINGTLDKAGMIQLQSDVNEDVKDITNQTDDVLMFTWQYEVHDSSQDYYNAYVDISDDVICAFPGYIIPHVDDGPNKANNIHFSPEGSRIAGEYFGIAYKRILIDGEDWSVLKPTSVRIDGNDLYVTFHVPVAPLKFDTDIVKSVSNYGFRLFTSGGTEKTISSVTIQGNDTVKIVCSSAVDSTDVLAYAYTPNESSNNPWSPENIARGNLCDSQKITSLTGRNLANFCVAFKKPLSFWMD